MSIALRRKALGLLALAVLVMQPATGNAEEPPIVAQLGKTYGAASWKRIEAIRYTFNAQLGALQLSRTWVWHPKTGEISYASKDKDGKPVQVTYNQWQLNAAPANVKEQIDPAFYNDEYNLLFPLHVYWDGAAVVDAGKQKLPLGKGTAEKIVVKYASGGYTPGDTWELYIGTNGQVEEFTYHRGGPRKPSLVTATWAGYKKAGPLLIATDRRGIADGKPVRIWMTNVAVMLTGSKNWLSAR
jgi:hypothetical protein